MLENVVKLPPPLLFFPFVFFLVFVLIARIAMNEISYDCRLAKHWPLGIFRLREGIGTTSRKRGLQCAPASTRAN